MSDSGGEPKVGYGRPPVKSRWKQGQCGNPNRQQRRASPTMKEMIDGFFSTEIWVTENGVRRRCSTFEAIVSQLCIKADAGNRRAARALLRYVDFTKEQGGAREI